MPRFCCVYKEKFIAEPYLSLFIREVSFCSKKIYCGSFLSSKNLKALNNKVNLEPV